VLRLLLVLLLVLVLKTETIACTRDDVVQMLQTFLNSVKKEPNN